MKKNALSAAFLGLCLLGTALYLILGYGAYLDSDMSSELELARHLADTGRLVSGEWYYSTEVRLLSTQLVFAPLMALFGGSWRLVRTLGCLILMVILAGSSLYAARKLGAKPAYARVFAGLVVCAGSPLYAQNVVIGAYYVPHAVMAMLMLGLYADVCGRDKLPRVRTAGLLLLALAMGVCSVRYLLQTLLPLFAAALWLYVFPREGADRPRSGRQNRNLLLALCALLLGAAGYAAGSKLLVRLVHYNADYYGSVGWADWAALDLPAQLQTVLRGLLDVLGFTGGVRVFGPHGVANALVLLEIAAALLLAVRCAKTEKISGEGYRLGALTALFCAFASLAVFTLMNGVYFDRYWLPVTMLFAPVLALCLSGEENVALRRMALLLFVGTTLLVSAMCMAHSMTHKQAEEDMRMAAIDEARAQGLDKGYATFWNANILTELSDGEIDVTALDWTHNAAGEESMKPQRWLEAEQSFVMDRPEEPVFLLVGGWESEGIEPFLERVQAKKAEIGGYIDFYTIPRQALLFEAMGE